MYRYISRESCSQLTRSPNIFDTIVQSNESGDADEWCGEIIGSVAAFSGLIRALRIAAPRGVGVGHDAEADFELRVLRKGDPLVAPLDRIARAPPGTIFLSSAHNEGVAGVLAAPQPGRAYTWTRRRGGSGSSDEGGRAGRLRPLRQRRLSFATILGMPSPIGGGSPTEDEHDAAAIVQQQWRQRFRRAASIDPDGGGASASTPPRLSDDRAFNATSAEARARQTQPFEVELKLAHKTVHFAYYPARDSPISVAEQMHREVDDEWVLFAHFFCFASAFILCFAHLFFC
jgi:hypothetical protein